MQKNSYDAVFVDGHHGYKYVVEDFKRCHNITRRIAFHDVNDYHCKDVRRFWKDVKAFGEFCGFSFSEFFYHSHDDQTMGIGLIQIPSVVPRTCILCFAPCTLVH